MRFPSTVIKRGGALDGFFEHLPDLAEKILARTREAEVKEEKAEAEAG